MCNRYLVISLLIAAISYGATCLAESQQEDPFLPRDSYSGEIIKSPEGMQSELSLFDGCKYSTNPASDKVRVWSPKFAKGCAPPQEICVAELDCAWKPGSENMSVLVACVAKDGKCPKDPRVCGASHNVAIPHDKNGAFDGDALISKTDDYFSYPSSGSKDSEVKDVKHTMEAK